MNTATTSTCVLMCCLLSSPAALAIDDPAEPAPAQGTAAEPPKSESHVWIDAGAGCLGGAALGTVLPGIGNIIGCIAGGASVWWLRRAPSR